MALKRKRLILRDIKPNQGIHARYRADLNGLLRSVRNDVLATVKAHWQKPAPIAMDNDTDQLAQLIDALLAEWLVKLDTLAEPVARKFVGATRATYDRNLSGQLRKAGFTVNLQMTEYTLAATRASIGMNVGLIRSIPTEYLGDVSKYVWEAVSGGFDLATLTSNLDHAYHIGRNRCKLIARDQASKAMAVIEQARRMDLGIKRAIWRHSSAAKVPRPSHVAANGKEFDIEKGMLIDGEYIQAGEKIQCGCTSRSIIEW